VKIFAAKTVDLGSGPIPRLILTLAVPAMISMFFQNLYAFIDTIFISWLGPVPLAAQAFSIPLFYIALSLGKGVQVGTATLISHARGSGDESQVGALARAALPLLLLLILPLFLLLIPRLSDLVFGLMGAKGLMLDQIYRYIFWLILGFPVMAYFMVCEAVFMSHGNTRMPMQGMLLGNFANLILAPLLMFVMDMGIAGASLAAFLGQLLSALYIRAKLKEYNLVVPAFKRQPGMPLLWRKIGRLGALVAITFLVSPLGLSLLNGVLASFSEAAVGAWNIMSRLEMLGLLPLNGMAASLIPFMAYNNAQKKFERIAKGVKYFLLMATAFIIPIMAIFIIFPHYLMLPFRAEGEVMALGSYAIRVAALGHILVPIDLALFSLAQGLQKPVYSLFTLGVRILLLRYPLAIFLGSTFGVQGVYWCQPGSTALGAVVSAFILWKLVRNLTRASHSALGSAV
jgi:putative MATE family efflux protein